MPDTTDHRSRPANDRFAAVASIALLAILAGSPARGQDGPPPDVLAESVLTEVEFRGRVNVGLAEIEARSGLKKGAKVDVFRVVNAPEEIRKLYRQRGYTAAEVNLVEGRDAGATRVVIEIVEGPKSMPIGSTPAPAQAGSREGEKSSLKQMFDPNSLKAGDAFRQGRSEHSANHPAPFQVAQQAEEEAIAHAERANQARQEKDFERALEETTAAIRLYPNLAEVYQYRGQIYAEMELPRRTIADLTTTIQLDPSADRFLARGNAYCLERDFVRGFSDIDTGFFQSVGNDQRATAHYHRGVARAFHGDHELAVDDLDRAIELGVEADEKLYQTRGQSLAKLGEHVRAIADFDRAIAIHPTESGWYSRGKSNFALGKYILAQADYERAMELCPNCGDCQQGRGWARLAQGQVDAAIDDFTCAIESNDETYWAFTGRGWAFLLKHDLDRATADFDKAIKLQPGVQFEFGIALDRCLSLHPKHDRAVAEFDERCRTVPNLRFALVILKGEEARSQFLHNPYFAAYLVGRTRASSEIAPNLIFRITLDWLPFPDAKSACVGRAIAAMLRSDWMDARHYLKQALKSFVDSCYPGATRRPLSDLLRGE